jgi:hypothetical protein
MRKVTVEAADKSKGMSPEEVVQVLTHDRGATSRTTLTASVSIGGKIKSLSWIES